jgi:AraC-like DNA-binding protein
MTMLRETIRMPPGQSFRMIRWTRSVSAVESLLADGSRRSVAGEGSRWHYHPEMELTLFTAGNGQRFVGDHIAAFAPGDLVLLGGMLPHYWHADGRTAGLSLQWSLPPQHPLMEIPESRPLGDLFQRARGGLRLTGITRERAAESIARLADRRGLVRFVRLLELLAMLAEAPASEAMPLASRSFVPPADATYQEAISRVLRHLVGNFRDEIRLEAVLRIARLSRPTFARQFKRHTGRCLSDFLIELRLQAACRELVDTSRSVLEIALDVGFTQVSFFNRVFRRTHGCSPSQFRSRDRTEASTMPPQPLPRVS